MTLFKVGSVGNSGVISDIAPQELPSNVWTDAKNVRFYNGAITNTLHEIEVLDEVSKPDLSTDHAQAILGYFVSDDTVFYATGDKIYKYSTSTHTDITNLSPTNIATSDNWISLIFSNCIVFSNPNSVPQILEPGTTETVDMPGWDVLWTTENMVSFKNYLVALSTTENGYEYKQRVRWSNAAPPNEAPADWDATDPNSHAGFNDLTDARGDILTAAMLADVLYVYTSEEIFAVQYIGTPNIFSFRKVVGSIGALNSKAVTQYKNGHVFVSRDNVYMFDGVTVKSIIDGKIRDKFYTKLNLDFKDTITVFSNQRFNEVWICFANDSSLTGELNEAAILNVETGTWTFRELPNIISIGEVRKPVWGTVIWNNANYFWNSADAGVEWSSRDYGGNIILASDSSGAFLMIDHTTSSNTTRVATLERKYLDLDDAGAKSTGVKRITSIYPQIGGVGSLYFRVGTSEYIGGPITWGASKLYVVGETRRLDYRLSGTYLSIQITSNDNANQWNFTGYDIEFEPRFRGRRTL